MRVHVVPVDWSSHREALRQVRETVFIDEQGVPRELEWDGADDNAFHFLALNEAGQAVGCARLLPSGQIGRMAVLPSQRGTGLGLALLRAAIDEAKRLGMRRVFLHAQSHAAGFYEKAGFLPEGAEFMEAGIPHRAMALELPIPFEPTGAPTARPQVREHLQVPQPGPASALQRCQGEHDCVQAVLRCLEQPRRRLFLLSQQLDPALFDSDAVQDRVSAFARSSSSVQVRILITDSSRIVSGGHRLVELARRLDSRIEIRRVPDELAPTEPSFLTWDETGYLLMPDFRDYSLVLNLNNPVQGQRLTDQFTYLWERSAADPELRTLNL